MKKYDHQKIEKKWQDFWDEKKTFVAKENKKKTKKYILVEFPYPSGAGLHMGHVRPFVAGDVYSRFMRLKGHEVLYPFGWDAFGLPAENYAIKMGVHPSITTKQNIANAKKQVRSWGTSFDWSREINTTDPNYYKWTQWLFLQFYKAGLAYEATGLINWCPKDKTGLANEEVIDGKCERCGTTVEKKELRQWYLRITDYAEKLLEGLKGLTEWPEPVKTQQQNWIGKSTGAEIEFRISNVELGIKVFTTRPDTIFGATYLVVAPEHPVIEVLQAQISNAKEVAKYIEKAKSKTEIERTSETKKEKTGVELKGVTVINPATKKEIPVWVADYVLSHYGTGAIMAVPAHDERDFSFAKKFKLAIKQVISKHSVPIKSYLMGGKNITDEEIRSLGITIAETSSSGDRKLIILKDALKKYEELVIKKLENGFWNEYVGDKIVFLFKHKDGMIERLVLEQQTAQKINSLAEEFAGKKFVDPWGMLASNSWYSDLIIHSDHGILINSEEFNSLPSQEAISKTGETYGRLTVQYKLRDWVFSRQRYWGEPIPIIHCKECGIVPVPEKDLPVVLPPVKKYEPTGTGESPLAAIKKWVNVKCPKCKGSAKRETNTMPQWAGSSWYWLRYTDPQNKKIFADKKKQKYWTPVDVYFGGMEHTTLHLLYSRFWNLFLYDQGLVTEKEPYAKRLPHGIILGPDGEKMSKSKGNVVSPDEVVKKFGADTMRMYELFLGSHEMMVSWNDQGILGVRRFLDRVWQWANEIIEAPHKKGVGERVKGVEDTDKVLRALNKLIKKITEDLENFRFNTCISAFMEFHNEIKNDFITLDSLKKFVTLLYPFAPHMGEELYRSMNNKKSLQLETWPLFDPKKIIDQNTEIIVQINGKVKGKITAPFGSSEEQVKAMVLKLEAVVKAMVGDSIKRVIFVPNKLMNLVI